MEIVEDRYGNGSIIVTSQLPVDAWHDVIDEPTFADAILDRLVHNTHRLPLDGPSMRKTLDAERSKPDDHRPTHRHAQRRGSVMGRTRRRARLPQSSLREA